MNQKVDDFLQHYGILGMRWGVRRSAEKLRRLAAKRGDSRDWDSEPGEGEYPGTSSDGSSGTTSSATAPKTINDLTNDELALINRRMQLEKQYKELKHPHLTKGKTTAENFIANFATKIATRAGEEYVMKTIYGEKK